jgi:hypothetical protein
MKALEQIESTAMTTAATIAGGLQRLGMLDEAATTEWIRPSKMATFQQDEAEYQPSQF